MKNFKAFFLPLLLLSTAFAQTTCNYDSIGGGGSGVASVDTSIIGPFVPRCTQCATQKCVAWQLPTQSNDTVAMAIYLYSNSGNIVSVQIVKDCNFLLWDTCIVLPPDPATPAYQPRFSIVGNAQILVCGDVGDTIILNVKIVPDAHSLLDAPYMDLNTCGTPVGLEDPRSGESTYWSIDLMTGRRSPILPPLPPGIYFQENETLSRRGRIVLVR